MIRSGDRRGSLLAECLIEMFGRHDLRLPSLLSVDCEGQSFAIIQDGDLFLRSDTDGDLGVMQSIGGAFGLDLVNGLVELEREIFRKRPSFLPRENADQVIFGGERAMGIDNASGLFGEALIEIVQELRQVGVTRFPGANLAQAHFFG